MYITTCHTLWHSIFLQHPSICTECILTPGHHHNTPGHNTRNHDNMRNTFVYAGVVENILGRVLEAFQGRMSSLLGTALSKGFTENPALALLMASEPAALLAGDPVAFFVGKATETTESFVKAVVQSGFGSGDESLETSILTQLVQVR